MCAQYLISNERYWNEKLLTAAIRGDTKSVEECLANGAQVNCTDYYIAETPLHRAAKEGQKDTVALLLSHGGDTNIKDMFGDTAFIVAANDQIRELIRSNREEGVPKINTEQLQQLKDHSAVVHFQRIDKPLLLNRLLGEGSYESYDMRVMVIGQFGVGKTSLVMILVGDSVPNIRQSTDGISLLEGRCGLGIEGRDWILINKDKYNAVDVVYNKVLMSSGDSKTTAKASPSQQEVQEKQIYQPQEEDKEHAAIAIPSGHGSGAIPKAKYHPQHLGVAPIQPWQHRKMKSKMTKKEIRKKMFQVLKAGKYTMKIGRLIFWDFGGQYVYYTTHQTFMTYRALFLVVFDGSKGLSEEVQDVQYFPGQHGSPTTAVFLQHWVNSILTYCKQMYPGIPKILFIATHKDKVPKVHVEEQRKSLYIGIEDLFKHHDGRNHLVLEHQLFVNATDKNDPEISTLKQVITDLTFEHPCWGEKMPNTWVPLELEIAELSARGKQILSIQEMEDLNKASEVYVLSSKDLKIFLQFQHSLGKIVYFDTPQLRSFVIISPLLMVDVMKSFVTDKQFWPEDISERQPFINMSNYGIIKKRELFRIWKRPEFSKVISYKDFLFDMLIHLDILSEQRRYDITTGSRIYVEEYFVPCMLTRINTTSYMDEECIPSRAIGLAFVFKGTVIPPALPNRLISACLSKWYVKKYEDEQMMFSGFVVLSCDKSHDIVVCVQSNKILVYMIHRRSKGLICRHTATGVRECMHTTLQRISEFYQSTSSLAKLDNSLPFHVELVCSELKCFLPEAEALQNKSNLCLNHGKQYDIDVWYQDESVDYCSDYCKGLSQDALCKTPTYSEILRLSSKLDAHKVRELAIHLGITLNDWNDIILEHPSDMTMVKFLVLRKWCDSMNGTFEQIVKPLTEIEESVHVLCQVRRMKKKPQGNDIPEEYLDCIPTDEILDALAPEIGKVSFRLGIELGRSVTELENIQSDYKTDSATQTKEILYRWRNDKSVKATLGVLQQALVNVERGTIILKKVVDECGVKTIDFQGKEKKTKKKCIIT